MKLLKVRFKHPMMFEDGNLTIDLYAEDKVPAEDDSVFCLGRPVYSTCILALAGINATGKTTLLNLLGLAVNVVCGRSLSSCVSDDQLISRIFFGTELDVVFEQSGGLYVLHSEIGLNGRARVSMPAEAFEFTSETLYRWPGTKMPKKALLDDLNQLIEGCEVHLSRSDLQANEKSFLSNNVSVATAVADRNTPCIIQPAFDVRGGASLGFEGAWETLHAFDPSVTYLQKGDGDGYSISFASGTAVYTPSQRGLDSILSSGTIKGLRFVENAVAVLSQGGYLLVDEIENHLNKQLVNVLIDLFQSSETNPYGATLIFTTHYPEVLDRIHRKDNVYFLVRSGGEYRMNAIKYSDKVRRIENKKSEVFLSNYIGGTAPKYVDVQALRSLVKEAVAHAKD